MPIIQTKKSKEVIKKMNDVVEKIYMTEKEAVLRYGYSRSWFQQKRWAGNSPPYIKINNGGVRYPIKECDGWFSNHGLRTSTSAILV